MKQIRKITSIISNKRIANASTTSINSFDFDFGKAEDKERIKS